MPANSLSGRIGKTTLELRVGDITRIAADALVNAANADLTPGGGVDGAIHRIGGPSIAQQCRVIGRCATGDAVVTGAGDLTAMYIIHAVAPQYSGKPTDAELLRSAYGSALRQADELKIKSVAFPSLGTGNYGYPIALAAPIALDTIGRYVSSGASGLERVVIVLFTRADYLAYERLFPKRPGSSNAARSG
jgi:O-acetyl-ADP-ribose deacetylase (regulator of RNase III)